MKYSIFTLVTLLPGVSSVSFKTTANGVMVNSLTGGETSTDSGGTDWNTLSRWSIAVTVIRTFIV